MSRLRFLFQHEGAKAPRLEEDDSRIPFSPLSDDATKGTKKTKTRGREGAKARSRTRRRVLATRRVRLDEHR